MSERRLMLRLQVIDAGPRPARGTTSRTKTALNQAELSQYGSIFKNYAGLSGATLVLQDFLGTGWTRS